jgi:O-antigen biosynthesis protein
VDYCYRLVDRGLRCVYCATAELTHWEGKSRGFADNPAELAAFRRRHGDRVDRWYNPNLSLDNERFEIAPVHTPRRIDRPVRAVMVAHSLELEGAPTSLVELARGLSRLKVIDPIVLVPADGPLRARLEAEGIPVRVIGDLLVGLYAPGGFEAVLADIGKLYRELEAEVIYANTAQAFWAVAASERAGLPTLWNIRESEDWRSYFDFLPPHLRPHAYACFSYPYRVIFVAQATRRGWQPLETDFNFTVIHNALDVPRFAAKLAELDRDSARARIGAKPADIVAVLVGTVCERKGQVDVVLALEQMDIERLRVFLVGDRASAYSAGLHDRLAALPASRRERIVIVPETDDVASYYRAADIALCTSRLESHPRIILEAMGAGLPIVTTPVFGIPEQVRENVNALFYSPGDHSALASALTRLVNDGGLRARFAANSPLVLASLTSQAENLARYGALFRGARLTRGAPYEAGR